MHQRHSPAGVMRRHRTTATPFENETVQTLWVWAVMFLISPLRGKHDAKRGDDCGPGPTQHRRINARNGEEQRMLRLWLSGHGEAPPSRGLRVPAPHDSPVQAINLNDDIVRVSRVNDCKATCCRFHEVCFARDRRGQQLAREVSTEKTDEILKAIAAREAAKAAVPSPLSFIRLPRAWLSLVPCACMYRCSETMGRLFLGAACTFRNRAVSDIARRQAHAGGFDRPAGGSFSCRGPVRGKAEGSTRR
jgi:hypothetical protein